MYGSTVGASKPKRLEAIEDAIYNGAASPTELQEYVYRREFGLTAQELADEPADQLFMNLQIYALIKDKEQKEAEHNNG